MTLLLGEVAAVTGARIVRPICADCLLQASDERFAAASTAFENGHGAAVRPDRCNVALAMAVAAVALRQLVDCRGQQLCQ